MLGTQEVRPCTTRHSGGCFSPAPPAAAKPVSAPFNQNKRQINLT